MRISATFLAEKTLLPHVQKNRELSVCAAPQKFFGHLDTHFRLSSNTAVLTVSLSLSIPVLSVRSISGHPVTGQADRWERLSELKLSRALEFMQDTGRCLLFGWGGEAHSCPSDRGGGGEKTNFCAVRCKGSRVKNSV